VAKGEGGSGRGGRHVSGPPVEDAPATPRWLTSTARSDVVAGPRDICRFLASEAPDGAVGPPIEGIDPANRCVALGDLTPQSTRQQELVCLAAAHEACPRYLRGLFLESGPGPRRGREPVSRAVIASAMVFVAAIAASFGFLAVRGGLSVELVVPSPESSEVAALSGSPVPNEAPSSNQVVTLPPSTPPSPSPSPAPSAEPTPSPSPTPTPAVTPPPTPVPTPRPSSDRYAVLVPCPSTANCWIYTVRSGDNLVSIAHWFGVPLDTVYAMNPWARTTGLRPGQELRLPPPTR